MSDIENDDFEDLEPTYDSGAADSDDEGAAAKQAADSEAQSLAIKNKIREQLQSDIEAFLQRGGQVQTIANDVRADPPRKPDMQYGSNPI
ncbi:hypothetical protein EUZ85_06705 [Hahella sp. KA22]|uniref:hypothetical protein n=1 Tax=Hahella sp. KA22 TaxID=1628392 RepID=UPI000FDD92EC|nr:hypothetical protein [Hahella sp. KA22]AZZ90426.1 hypothetical protein ENC22_04155 [Hahella sp. KA22]QAY53796.1 hypothetical protein EUZ85_06705 [Hahella sp. KA22]